MPTRIGDKDMKLLKINDNQGYYRDDQGKFVLIDRLTKEDLLRLVDLTLGEEEIEFDEINKENLKNQAHQIIYKSVIEKLQGLKERKKEFIDKSERLYLEDYEKYRDELSQESA